jgi:hypothetical protein
MVDTRRLTALLLAGGTCIAMLLAGAMHPNLLRARAALGPTALAPLERATPLVTFSTVALGGFRGIIADMLWLRSSALQEDGRYFEIVQLADWITKLEPRLTEVWAYHAWNMAFNIGGMMPTPADRWRWVRNGYVLLRDEGIRHNPGDPMMYFELGWLFQSKIGGRTDPTEAFYRRLWAAEMDNLLGPTSGRIAPALANPAHASALASEYRLQPDLIRALEARYAPLDWRLPETHAVYWAYCGTRVTRAGRHLKCNRMIYQSLTQLFLRGRFPTGETWNLQTAEPDLRLARAVVQAYEDTLQGGPVAGTIVSYGAFLHKAVNLLHAAGENTQARELFAILVQRFPDHTQAKDFETYVAQPPF